MLSSSSSSSLSKQKRKLTGNSDNVEVLRELVSVEEQLVRLPPTHSLLRFLPQFSFSFLKNFLIIFYLVQEEKLDRDLQNMKKQREDLKSADLERFEQEIDVKAERDSLKILAEEEKKKKEALEKEYDDLFQKKEALEREIEESSRTS